MDQNKTITAERKSCHCPTASSKVSKKSTLPFLSGLFIALIPKCSFCILAYSSAVTLCSGTKVYDHAPQWTSYISIVLALMTLVFVLINYRGTRTIIAAVMVLAGSGIILWAELITGQPDNYYLGLLYYC